MDYKKLLQEERLKVLRELSGSSCSAPTTNNSSSKQSNLIPLNLTSSKVELIIPDAFALENYRIGIEEGLDSIYYIPNVLNQDDEAVLVDNITKEGDHNSQRWTQLRTRRLQCWGKFPPSADKYSSEISRNDHIPPWLKNVIEQITLKLSVIFNTSHPPNNVLINQYRPSEGILHHTDGPLYEDKVLIISLQSDCLMTFRRNLTSDQIGKEYGGDVFSVLLRRNSCLYFTKNLYTQFMHGIAADDVHTIGGGSSTDGNSCPCLNGGTCQVAEGDTIVRGQRTSLTFRILKDVPV